MRSIPLGLVTALFAACSALASEPVIAEVDFQRHIAPLLGKLGCNAASCHGAAEGKGGFRLSLFGYDEAADYRAICREDKARRVNRLTPAKSLLLQKALGQVPHGGGRRIERDSWQRRLVEQWIACGAPFAASEARIETVTMRPSSIWLGESSSAPLSVVARLSDGSEADVTPFCEFRVQDDFVAEVSEQGQVAARNPGDTAIIATYGGRPAVAHIVVPRTESRNASWPPLPPANFIDVEIFAKLRRLGVTPSPRSGDAEFLRRLHLTTIGALPAPEHVKRFLADPRPDKRAREIERLLAHPLHAAVWATRFSEITGNQIDAQDNSLGAQRAAMWHGWLRRRFADNRPMHEMAREILTAVSRGEAPVDAWIAKEAALVEAARSGRSTGYENKPGLDLYWHRGAPDGDFPVEEIAERTAVAFLGVRIECARCHKHPFDRWTQADYRAFANIFSQVRLGTSPELRAGMFDLLERRRRGETVMSAPLPRLREVFITASVRDAVDPVSHQPLAPRALGGPELIVEGDRRQAFADWLLDPTNPYFARSLVNRVWQHCFGRGLVEPADGFSDFNPPTHPILLAKLAEDFVMHGYDLRRLERLILTSTAWQLSSAPNETNLSDRHNYSRSYVRVLPAEVVWDVLGDAIGSPRALGEEFPAGMRAIEVASSRVRDQRLGQFFRVFNRPDRARACDCQGAAEPTVRQALLLMSESTLQKELAEGRIASLLKGNATDDEMLEAIFLATLTRFPTPNEQEAALAAVAESANRKEAWRDVLWALINTREFITNH